MTTETKLAAARATLEGTTVNWDQFCKKLAEFFGYDSIEKVGEDDISCMRFEDLEDCGLPRGKARRVAQIFRGQESDTSAPTKVIMDVTSDPEKHAATISPVECVERYNPDDPSNPYGQRIAAATGKRKCIVFDPSGQFHVEMTKLLVQEIIDGYPERESVTVDDVPGLLVYVVGERPDKFVPENPAKPGTPLSRMPDFDWQTIPKDTQQLLYIAVRETKEAAGDSEHDLWDKIYGKNFNQVAKRYPKAAVAFRSREAANTLPQLKIRIGNGKGQRPNDPFHVRS